ncbi:MAG: hypothetical protein CSB47_00380 [Proteobacteria bacterium]|nr:MAG: hypothetical protein CSB47_00380 [Pseudomonadota bacterium]
MEASASVLTITVLSVSLYFVGFYVIPVFAEKTPQLFANQHVRADLITDGKKTWLPQDSEKQSLNKTSQQASVIKSHHTAP